VLTPDLNNLAWIFRLGQCQGILLPFRSLNGFGPPRLIRSYSYPPGTDGLLRFRIFCHALDPTIKGRLNPLFMFGLFHPDSDRILFSRCLLLELILLPRLGNSSQLRTRFFFSFPFMVRICFFLLPPLSSVDVSSLFFLFDRELISCARGRFFDVIAIREKSACESRAELQPPFYFSLVLPPCTGVEEQTRRTALFLRGSRPPRDQ